MCHSSYVAWKFHLCFFTLFPSIAAQRSNSFPSFWTEGLKKRDKITSIYNISEIIPEVIDQILVAALWEWRLQTVKDSEESLKKKCIKSWGEQKTKQIKKEQ